MSFDKDRAKARRPDIYGPITFLGQEVFVRSETARDRDERDWKVGSGQPIELRAFYVTRCVVDEEGIRIFTDDDQEWIGESPVEEVEKIYQIATRGMSAEELEALKKKSVTLASATSGE